MIDCIIMGDSIAVGSHHFRKECVSYSKGGITSHGWNQMFTGIDLKANTVIISLGTNDWEKTSTFDKLMIIRSKVKANQVFWIAPHPQSKPKVYNDVKQVAQRFNDKLIETQKYQTDKIHPSWSGYQELMNQTK